MNSADETIIERSKAKIVLLMLLSCAIVALGAWLFSLDEATIRSQRRFNNPMFVHGIGLVTVLIFGLCVLVGLKMLFDKKPGLVFNSSGIVDNASDVAAGFIPWSEIVGTRVLEIQKQKTLIIGVRDPQKYIDRGGALRRTLNKSNYKMVGSPIAISSSTLKINFSELVSLFDQYRHKYGVRPGGADVPPPSDKTLFRRG
jgi:hypothetical protein